MFGLFSGTVVKALAKTLGEDFCQHMPPAELARGRASVERRFQSARDRMMSKIERHAEHHRIGFFQRVIFANTLKWHLREAGYANDLVDALVLDAVKRMALAKGGAEKAR